MRKLLGLLFSWLGVILFLVLPVCMFWIRMSAFYLNFYILVSGISLLTIVSIIVVRAMFFRNVDIVCSFSTFGLGGVIILLSFYEEFLEAQNLMIILGGFVLATGIYSIYDWWREDGRETPMGKKLEKFLAS